MTIKRLAWILVLVCLAVMAAQAGENPKNPLDDPFAKPPKGNEKFNDPTPWPKEFRDPAGNLYGPPDEAYLFQHALWYMKEPSLNTPKKAGPDFALRFIWSRTFHDPIAIRVWGVADGHMLRVVRITQKHDYSWSGIAKDVTRKLDPAEWTRLEKLIQFPLLTAPMTPWEKLTAEGGMDGSQWIFETYVKQHYSMLHFWCLKDYGKDRYASYGSPNDKAEMRDTAALLRLALELIKIADLRIPEKEVY